MNLYTYILEFRNGTYITQVSAKTVQQSIPKWINSLKSELKEIEYLNAQFISAIEQELAVEQPILLKGKQSVWCLSFTIKQGLGLVNIVETYKPLVTESNKKVTYKHWKLAVDYSRTKEVYNQQKTGSAEICNCLQCENFVANRNRVFPEKFKQFLAKLGIDYTKEAEVYHMGEIDNNKHFYGGWFHFKGKIVDNTMVLPTNSSNTISINKDFKVKIIQNSSLSFFGKEEHKDLIQIEFFANSDWVIDKKQNYFKKEWLIELLKEQKPKPTDLILQLEKMTTTKWIKKPYIRFVNNKNANQKEAEWQFIESIVLEHKTQGTIVLDVLKDGSIGGFELLNELD